MIVGQNKRWFIAVPDQINLLNIRWIVIVDPLSLEIEFSCLLGVKFKADDSKTFASYQTDWWIRFECPCRILKDFVVDWSITCI